MPSALTAGFNCITQLSEGLLNTTVKELFRRKAFPTNYSGHQSHAIHAIGLTLNYMYEANLTTVDLFLDTGQAGGLGFKASIEASLQIRAEFAPDAGHGASRFDFKVNVSAEIAAWAKAVLIEEGDRVHLALSFGDITEIDLVLTHQNILGDKKKLIAALLRRILTHSLRNQVIRIPLSTNWRAHELGGYRLEPPTLRVIDSPAAQDPDNVTFAVNTWPNRGRGQADKLVDFLGAGDKFGLIIDQRFIVQYFEYLWETGKIPRRFNTSMKPDPTGRLRIPERPIFDFQDGRLLVTLRMLFDLDGDLDPGVTIHAGVSVTFNNGKFKVIVTDIDLESNVVVQIVGFLVFNLLWFILLGILGQFLSGFIKDVLNTTLDDIIKGNPLDLIYRGAIPGTSCMIQSTLEHCSIRADGVVAVGSVVFADA